jgi:hypothetical protein
MNNMDMKGDNLMHAEMIIIAFIAIIIGMITIGLRGYV